MNDFKKELIALEVIRTLKSRFDNFPEDASDNRNAPFHEAFLNAFKIRIEKHVTDIPIFVSLASWMHGLNTSLGLSFFENVAHILSDGIKRKFVDQLITAEQQSVISNIISGLKNHTREPNLIKENEEIFLKHGEPTVYATNFTADELWDFLSQEKDTMPGILEIINSIAKPDFMEKFNFINDPKNFEINSEKFKAILSQWYLHRDLKIFNNYSKLKKAAETEKRLQRILKQNLFDSKTNYKETRAYSLLNAL